MKTPFQTQDYREANAACLVHLTYISLRVTILYLRQAGQMIGYIHTTYVVKITL